MKAKVKKTTTKRVRVGPHFPDLTLPRESEKWQFCRDGVSPSHLNTFLECRESFRLKTCEGWQEADYDTWTQNGTFFHWLHEQWILSKKTFDVVAAVKRYRSKVYDGPKTSSVLGAQEESYALALAMWPIYMERYASDKEREWLGVEKVFDHPYEVYPGVSTRLRGMRDGAWVEKWGVRLHEMKNWSRFNVGDVRDTMHLEVQIMLYLLVLSMEYPDREVSGADYDVIRRPEQKRLKDETLREYSRRIETKVELDPDHYFVRIPLDVNRADVEKWRDVVLQPLLIEMHRWSQGKAMHFVNPRSLVPRPYKSDLLALVARGDATGLKVGDPFGHHTRPGVPKLPKKKGK